jgi:hypothetical protein
MIDMTELIDIDALVRPQARWFAVTGTLSEWRDEGYGLVAR